MVSISVKVDIPKKPFTTKKWLDEIARQQRRTSVPRLKKLFEQTVFGWSKKPDFGWVQQRTTDQMSITMYPKGEAADVWILVNDGARAHPITARSGGIMTFQKGYRPSTTPGSLMSSRKYLSNPVWQAMVVAHPGFEPRRFTEVIAKAYTNPFIMDMQVAVNSVARSK